MLLLKGHMTRCAINPALGELDERRVRQYNRKKHVVVVGSGPGGLEAAITTAARGHRVTLYEKDTEGQWGQTLIID